MYENLREYASDKGRNEGSTYLESNANTVLKTRQIFPEFIDIFWMLTFTDSNPTV